MARQKYHRPSARCCRVRRVSADRAARPGPHTRGKPRLLDVGRRIPARDRFAPDSPLEEAVMSEPVSGPNSLVTGKNTGNFIRIRAFPPKRAENSQSAQCVTSNSLRTRTGYLLAPYRELYPPITETFGRIRERRLRSTQIGQGPPGGWSTNFVSCGAMQSGSGFASGRRPPASGRAWSRHDHSPPEIDFGTPSTASYSCRACVWLLAKQLHD
jgi:hypothetical protein